MLTGGYVPSLPCLPIVEIKLQGKIAGYNTDDVIVTVKNTNEKKQHKLLGQIKSSIQITKSSKDFSEVMQAAWDDFNNSDLFNKDRDIIALITGFLSITDTKSIRFILDQARCTTSSKEFFRNIQQANFSSQKYKEKLKIISDSLKKANNNTEVLEDDIYNFLKVFHLLIYDLDEKSSVVLSLIHSHISQLSSECPKGIWGQIVTEVQQFNRSAGTITKDNLPDDLLEKFIQKSSKQIPQEILASKKLQEVPNLTQYTDLDAYIALIILIGCWNENNENDTAVINKLLGIEYSEWQQKAQAILHMPNSVLSLKKGIWKINNRDELLKNLGSRIFDNHLDSFKSIAIDVLQELDPAFELAVEQRPFANIHGKILKHSQELRQGIADGLAILGANPKYISYSKKTEEICVLTIRDIFHSNNWVIWASLNCLLPSLAEASPNEFLNLIDKTLKLTPCPFDELFTQESVGVFGRCYISGLLWALESLAWDEKYFSMVCLHLAKLASYDPGGQWANRPFNSLTTILLPWLPQTLAPIEKRKILIKTLLKEYPNIAWKLIISLLPNTHQSSSPTQKPKWRNLIPVDRKEAVTPEEYWQQISYYAELAVDFAKNNITKDITKLAELINYFDQLPESAFNQLVEVLSSVEVINLSENQRLILWENLTKFIKKHQRHSSEKWAMADKDIINLETIANKIAPKNLVNLYKHLFTDREHELYEETDDFDKQQENLNQKRKHAIQEIFKQDGIDGVIKFAESVTAPRIVGYALASINNIIKQKLLPAFLDTTNTKHQDFISLCIAKCNHLNSQWCDSLDTSTWTSDQKAQFLAYLPFTKNTWSRSYKWLKSEENKYWSCATASPYDENDGNLTDAIDKLLKYNRPIAAINCLYSMMYSKQPIEVKQCIRALLDLNATNKIDESIDKYHIIKLIEFIQSDASAPEEDILKIEWGYLPLLDYNDKAYPKFLENKLANDPKFFVEVIQLCYKSKNTKNTKKVSQAKATQAWRLLHSWKTPPGLKTDNSFDAQHFNQWLEQVKTLCKESGYLEIALECVGRVLFYAPEDTDGLWINKAVAQVINEEDAEDLCNGFSSGIYNSRGVHRVDKTGKAEKDIAKKWYAKTKAVEKLGYFRFAHTLKNVAKNYERDSARTIEEYATD
jgi:hypothetical protein